MSLPHLATLDVTNTVAHSFVPNVVANVGILSYRSLLPYIATTLEPSAPMESIIFVHHFLHSIDDSKHRGLPAVVSKLTPSATLL